MLLSRADGVPLRIEVIRCCSLTSLINHRGIAKPKTMAPLCSLAHLEVTVCLVLNFPGDRAGDVREEVGDVRNALEERQTLKRSFMLHKN